MWGPRWSSWTRASSSRRARPPKCSAILRRNAPRSSSGKCSTTKRSSGTNGGLAAAGHRRKDDDGVAVVDRRLESVEDADVLVVQIHVHVAVELTVFGEELALRVRVRINERGQDLADGRAVGRYLGVTTGLGTQDGWDLHGCRRHRATLYGRGRRLAGRGAAEKLLVGELAHLLDR